MDDFSTLDVIPRLPAYFDPAEGKPLPEGLAGSTVVRVGTVPEGRAVTGGGLVIDFRPHGSKKVRRVVFAFNDQGMWVEYESELPGSE